VKEGALIDRVVLITGSSRGIGAEVAVKAAAEGAHVAVHYQLSKDGAEGTVERARSVGAEAESFQADIGDGRGGLTRPALRVDLDVTDLAALH